MDEATLARKLADVADEIAMQYFSKNPKVWIKSDGTPVTEADKQIEDTLRLEIKQQFPNYSLLGEEEGLEGDPSKPIWVLDPIDGTANFAAGIPIFATLIGLRVEGLTQLGIASAPALGERYEGAVGNGATMNGQAIHVSDVADLGSATISFGAHRRMIRHGYGDQVRLLIESCKRDRGLGDFWGHMLVARGALEAMVEPALGPWDVIPLEVIVNEAGGKITNFQGAPYPESKIGNQGGDDSCISSNGSLHSALLEKLTPKK